MHPEEFEQLQKSDLIVRAGTIDEAATFFGIDAAGLKTSVASYNAMSAVGSDSDFGRGGKLANFNEGPFYLQKVVPSVHHTMGGIRISTETEVLDAEGNPIPGLYAAGAVVGGVHGTNRLGGNAITDLVVFGRIAGRAAAAK